MNKKGVKKYYTVEAFLALLFILLVSFVSGDLFQDKSSGDFSGDYSGTFYNSSGFIQLNYSYLNGNYTSRIFDAGRNAVWNNISYNKNLPQVDIIFAVDAQSDVWKSADSGVTWSLVKDDYNGGLGNGATAMAVNSSGALFILYGQDVWSSLDNGITWVLANDDFNGAGDSNAGQVLEIDTNNYLYIIDGSEDVFKSTDSGVSFAKVNGSDFNNGNGNIFGIASSRAYTNLTISVKNCSLADCSDGVFVDVNLNNLNFTGRYFQYRFSFISPDSSASPLLYNVSVDYSLINIAPSLSIVSPESEENYGFNSSVSLNFSVYDVDNNLDKCWYNIDNGNNVSLTNCQNITFRIAGNGSYVLNLYANDSFNLINSSSVSFNVINSFPELNIVSPQNGANYGTNQSLGLNFSAYDADNNLDKCWYNIDNGNNVSLSNCMNRTFNVSGSGTYILNLYVNDSLGWVTRKNVSFSVNIGAPNVLLYFPIDSYLNNNNVVFNYTPSDTDLRICELWGNFTGEFKLNQTNNSPLNNLMNSFYLNLSDGRYLWNIRCNDSFGNSAFNGNKTFYVDTTFPNLSIISPSGKQTTRNGIVLSISVSDLNLNRCWYNVYRGSSIEVQNTTVNCSQTGNFNVTVDADFILNLYANDSAGNVNSISSSFSIDTTTPATPPSPGGGSSGGSGGGVGIVSNKTQSGQLSLSKIENIIVYPGNKKTLLLPARNSGKIFLNNCKLVAKGTVSNWMNSKQISGISPGENINFIFDLNIPEDAKSGDYSLEFEVNCDEANGHSSLSMTIPEALRLIKIKEIKQDGNLIEIFYDFEGGNSIGNEASIELWIADEFNVEIKRVKDNFMINNRLTERNVSIELPKSLAGIYSLYAASSSDLANPVKQSFVLGKSSGTGFTILDQPGNKIIAYIVFLLIIGIGIFFIVWNNRKNKDTDVKGKKRIKKKTRNDEDE